MSLPPSGLGGHASKHVSTQPDDLSDDYSDSDSQPRAGTYASGAAGNNELDDWSEGEDGDEEEKDDPALCLFCDTTLPDITRVKEHLLKEHGFDFRAVAKSLQLDFYQQMRVINYIRERKAAGEPAAVLAAQFMAPQPNGAKSPSLAFLFDGSETYFKPFLAEDPLLFSLPKHSSVETGDKADDLDDEHEEKEDDAAAGSETGAPSIGTLIQENQALRNELEAMHEAMRVMQSTLKRVAFNEAEDSSAPPALETTAPAGSSSSSASSTAVVPAAAKPSKPADSSSAPGSFAPDHIDRDYFGGYSTRNIHELMLRDTIRTEAYRDFIYKSGKLFEGKIVLDVGCGTGILSMFAAKMGAKMVIGVDAAEIVHKAREIISANGLSHIITVLHGKMEEVTLPVPKVDIIISEWMGYFLLFESMLPSVLFARDRYLREVPSVNQPIEKATGVYPNLAIMYISGIETSKSTSQRLDWWKNVYGFNMSCLIEEREKFQSSTVEIIRPDQVITTVVTLKTIDVQTCKDKELDFTQDFSLDVNKPTKELFTGFMIYFDTPFNFHTSNPINLSTAPMTDVAPEPELTTHWQQSVFYLAKPLEVKEGDKINGKLKAKRMVENPRAYDVIIEYSLTRDGKQGITNSQEYKVQ